MVLLRLMNCVIDGIGDASFTLQGDELNAEGGCMSERGNGKGALTEAGGVECSTA